MLSACAPEPEPEPTYTVWIATFAFDSEHDVFGTLQNGAYKFEALAQNQFDDLKSKNFQDKTQHEWTGGQILTYLRDDWGLSIDETVNLLMLFLSYDHGIIGMREESNLKVLLK
jgi:hypothetical protein